METISAPYQVCLYVGPEASPVEGMKVVDLTPVELTPDAVLAKLKTSELAPSDLRARVVLKVEGDPYLAVAVYAALMGFAGRRLDVTDGSTLVVVADLESRLRALTDLGKPDPVPVQIQVSPTPHRELPSISAADGLSPADISAIRYAKRVRFAPADGDPAALAAVSQLIILAELRARGDVERLPYLVNGDEPVSDDDAASAVGLCLDTLRRSAVEVRRSMRTDDRSQLAPKADLTTRQRTLLAASAVPIEKVLSRLGATQDESSGLWHCPRPERHNHGDANASMRVVRGKTQCFRCDQERVDSLRLTMDTKGLVPDDAATWLLALAASGEPTVS